MPRYAPKARDLASRDVVSRAITVEILEGRGVGPNRDYVNLHLEHLGADVIKQRLPGITEMAKTFCGVDAAVEPIPVLPTVHYNMGGIPTNIHGEVLKNAHGDVLPGLMAIGEAACVSVHGANRLGTNSLLDLIVFGRAAALRAQELIKPGADHMPMHANATDETLQRFDKLRHAEGTVGTAAIRLKMQQTMQNHCAVFRKQDILEKGIEGLLETYDMMNHIHVQDRSLIWNTDLMEALELQNMLPQAMVTLQSALYRTESRGAHARDDFPERDDVNWLKHTLCWWNDVEKSHTLDTRPVHMNTLTKDVAPIPLQKRVY